MRKIILVIVTALFLAWIMNFACAEEPDDELIEFEEVEEFDEFDDFEEFDDFADFDDIGTEDEYIEAIEENGDSGNSGTVSDHSKEEYKAKVQKMSEISGYDDPDLKIDGDYAYYVSDDETYCITSLYRGSSTDIIVPTTLGGYPVKIIGDHTFENKSFIHTVEVPDVVVRHLDFDGIA